MTGSHLSVALCSFLLAACTDPTPTSGPAIFDADLAAAYAHFDQSLGKQRSPLSFEGNGTATDCPSYLEKVSKFRIDETVDNRLVKSEYLICDALKLLADSFPRPAAESMPVVAGKALLSTLDLRTFPSSQNMLSDDRSHTLAVLYPDRASSDATTAWIDTEDWSLTLKIVAAARLNDNAADDWVVWLSDESKTGDYRSYQTLVIYDPSDQHDALSALAYPVGVAEKRGGKNGEGKTGREKRGQTTFLPNTSTAKNASDINRAADGMVREKQGQTTFLPSTSTAKNASDINRAADGMVRISPIISPPLCHGAPAFSFPVFRCASSSAATTGRPAFSAITTTAFSSSNSASRPLHTVALLTPIA